MPPTVLTATQQKLLNFLIDRARRSPGQTITYGELARTLDPDFNPRDRHHVKLINNLYSVNRYCSEQNMPLFGCLVVRASDRQQGDGFYILARELGLLHSEQPEHERKFRDDQIAQTIEYARSIPEAPSVADEPSITVHILQVNDSKENTDELARSVSIKRTETDWQMPKDARPGDVAVWYASGPHAGIYVAWGWVDGVPYHVEEGPGPYRGTVGGMRQLDEVTRQYVIDHCGVNGGVQSYQTLTRDRALDFLEAVGLGLIAETVKMLAKAARRKIPVPGISTAAAEAAATAANRSTVVTEDHGGYVSAELEHPDIRYVVYPVHRDGTPTGKLPRMRHDPDCGHFYWGDGEFLGTPVLATEEQMKTLKACDSCVKSRRSGSSRVGQI